MSQFEWLALGVLSSCHAYPLKQARMNQLVKRILDEATGDEPKTEPRPVKNQAAVELGKLGGKKGGAARAAKLSPEQRTEIAKKAAASRWKSKQAEAEKAPVFPPAKKKRIGA